MEYTKMQYFLFKMSNLFNSKLFMIVIALIIIIGVTSFFIYDYKNNGSFFSQSSEDNTYQRTKHLKKVNRKTEILLIVFPLLLIVIMFGIRISISHVPSPYTIVPNKSETKVTKGKVLWVHSNTGKLAVTTKNRGDDNPIVVGINDSPVNPDAPMIFQYAGTSISNEEFLTLNPGDNVEIHTHPYKWLYKNHSEYGNDKHASSVMKMLNLADVNGDIIKSKPDYSKKKNNKALNDNIQSQNTVYSNDLE